MIYIKDMLERKITELNEIIDNSSRAVDNAPKGNIVARHNKNTVQYYQENYKSHSEKYILKKDYFTISGLIQKEYLNKIIKSATKQRNVLTECIQNYNEDEILKIYLDMHIDKKSFVEPLEMPDEEYAAIWLRKQQEAKDKINAIHKDRYAFHDEDQDGIYTENNERVRSKSEKILADKFKKIGVPYIYERPVNIVGVGYIRPDFLLLNKRTRKEYYYEHFGMMDNEEYCNLAIKKIENFERNGYYVGENILMSFETLKHPINNKNVDNIIKTYLI